MSVELPASSEPSASPELDFLQKETTGLRLSERTEKPKTAVPAGKRIPVARIAPVGPRVEVEVESDEAEPWFPRALRKGLMASLVAHVVLLFLLAVLKLTGQLDGPRRFETQLGGGSLMGSELGDQLQGGLGMDEQLALPEAPAGTVLESTPALTSLTPTIMPELPEIRANGPPGTPSSGGVALTGSGQAGSGDAFGVARFGSGTEKIKGIEVKVGDPQFTLIWEGRADIDLHVQEPGGSHIYWPDENRHGAQGGELDVDNRTGPGPENVYWVQGKGPLGVYRWYVEYYGPAPFEEFTGPVRWRVRVKHAGKTNEYRGSLTGLKDRSKTYTLTIQEKDRSGD